MIDLAKIYLSQWNDIDNIMPEINKFVKVIYYFNFNQYSIKEACFTGEYDYETSLPYFWDGQTNDPNILYWKEI